MGLFITKDKKYSQLVRKPLSSIAVVGRHVEEEETEYGENCGLADFRIKH